MAGLLAVLGAQWGMYFYVVSAITGLVWGIHGAMDLPDPSRNAPERRGKLNDGGVPQLRIASNALRSSPTETSGTSST